MLNVGQKVSFVPYFNDSQISACRGDPVIGTVFLVNYARQMFFVQFHVHGVIMREGFQFFDLYRKVHPLRPPIH